MTTSFHIPDSWLSCCLGEVIDYGQTTKVEPNEIPANAWVLELEDIEKDTSKLLQRVKFSQRPSKSTKNVFSTGDVLYGKLRPYLNKVLIADRDGYCSTEIIPLKPNLAIENRFLFYWLKNPQFLNYAKSKSHGLTMPRLSTKAGKQAPLVLAPYNEQKQIADKLDHLLARVDECRARLERISIFLNNFRKATLNLAMSGKLTEDWREANHDVRFSSKLENGEKFSLAVPEKELPLLPSTWRWTALGNYAQCSRGKFSARPRNDPAYFDGLHPFIQIGDLPKEGGWITSHHQTLNERGLEVSKKFSKGTVVIAIVGSTIGNTGILTYDMCFPDSLVGIESGDEISNRYIEFFLRYKKEEIRLSSYAGGGQPNIKLGTLNPFPFSLPPHEEQYEIVRRIEDLFAYADRLENRLEGAFAIVEQLTPTILSKAFSGELISQQPQDEPASILLESIRAEKSRLESEPKTTRTIRHTVKKIDKVSMETSSDYLEALSSAFAKSGENDARQLFDQAGFSPEEVVEFYEALRIAPEVRYAFEQSRQELPSKKQSPKNKRADTQISGNEKFRLVDLWLEEFKNLVDYTVHFDDSHSVDIVLGWNGTGKSNLFEALVIIFRDLHEWSQPKSKSSKSFSKISLLKSFQLRYKISGQLVDISWNSQEMTSPILRASVIQEDDEENENLKKIGKSKLPLPQFVFGYYSGPTNRLAKHFLPMNQNHYKSLLEATSDDPETLASLLEKRCFFCAENHHAKYVLLAFFHKEDPAISQFLESRLRIIGFESALFVIRKPRWARSSNPEDFWGADGVMRRVMERLRRFAIAPMVVKQNVLEGYRPQSEEHYYFFLPDLQSLHAFAAEYQDARTFFLALESIDFSELIYDLKIQVRVQATKEEQVAITFHELSEGEQQLLMVLGLMRFTKSHQSLVLLDEPDTHLNPHWSVDYLKLLSSVMSETSDESEEQKTSQILMSTHDPLVIAGLLKEQIHLLKRDWKTDICKWEQPTINPRGLGFTGILTSEMFGMRSDLDEETLADLDNQVRLVAKEESLSSEEAEQLHDINSRLDDIGFQKSFSDPYYAAFARAWGKKHSELMSGARFLSSEQKEEIDRISRELLEESIAELEAEIKE